jgi:hypothetical protein
MVGDSVGRRRGIHRAEQRSRRGRRATVPVALVSAAVLGFQMGWVQRGTNEVIDYIVPQVSASVQSHGVYPGDGALRGTVVLELYNYASHPEREVSVQVKREYNGGTSPSAQILGADGPGCSAQGYSVHCGDMQPLERRKVKIDYLIGNDRLDKGNVSTCATGGFLGGSCMHAASWWEQRAS